MSEHDVWESRYGVPEFIFGKEPNHFLLSCRNLLPKSGKALAIADGEGRNGVWLAEQGLDVVALDFSEAAQIKAASLAKERGVEITLIRADVQAWDYPANAFDVVIDIFTQFSSPTERAKRWWGVHQTLKPGGLVIVQGYTPRQLQYGPDGPKKIENLYTRDMLEDAFRSFRDMTITEEERDMHEGAAHCGMSAVIGLTARNSPRGLRAAGWMTRIAAPALFITLIPVIITMHIAPGHAGPLFKNIAILGALVHFFFNGSGAFSIDRFFRKRRF